jgi:hypothetical protein
MRLCERGPAHERSECLGCSEAISLAWDQSLGDCRVADAPLGPVGLAKTPDSVPHPAWAVKSGNFHPLKCCSVARVA